MKKRTKKKGFTLIELIVVIAILGILAAIAIPKLSGFTTTAKVKSDYSTAATIGHAAQAYLVDHPTASSLDVAGLKSAGLLPGTTSLNSQSGAAGAWSIDVTGGDVTVTANSTQFYPQ